MPRRPAARVALRRRLVDNHLALVRHLAHRIHRLVGAQVDRDDLVAFGVTGLCEAADRYDPGSGARFSTFAYYRVRGAIYDGLGRMGHLPRHEQRRRRAAQAADAAAAARSVQPQFVGSIEVYQERTGEVAATGRTAEIALAEAQLGRHLSAAIAELPARERHLVERYYYHHVTLDEAAAELGLQRSWASRLHARALDRLRRKLAPLA